MYPISAHKKAKYTGMARMKSFLCFFPGDMHITGVARDERATYKDTYNDSTSADFKNYNHSFCTDVS